MPQVRRADRVSRLIQDELSQVVRKDVKDSRVQGVTFTRVAMSSDLRRGTVFFVPLGGLGDDVRVAALQAGLDSARKFIEQRVFKNLGLRSRPNFTFKYDTGVQNLVEVHDVLSKLSAAAAPAEEAETAEDEATSPEEVS